MKFIKNDYDDSISLELTEEEYEKIKPFLNRYGFLDKFDPKNYPNGYPRPVTIFDWMFPETIKETKKRNNSEETKNE